MIGNDRFRARHRCRSNGLESRTSLLIGKELHRRFTFDQCVHFSEQRRGNRAGAVIVIAVGMSVGNGGVEWAALDCGRR